MLFINNTIMNNVIITQPILHQAYFSGFYLTLTLMFLFTQNHGSFKLKGIFTESRNDNFPMI